MAVDIPLYWVAATDADSSTDYRITSDKAASGTFATVTTRDATDRGDGSYTPYSTTLNGGISAAATTIILTSGANFSANDYAAIEREIVKLGTKLTHTFSSSTRGIGASIPRTHADLVTVYKAHETYTDTAVDFGARFLIRYKIIRVQGSSESVAAEILAINPPTPPSNDYCTVYGIVNSLQNAPQNVTVSLGINDDDNYIAATGELLRDAAQATTSDSDGFWYHYMPKDSARVGGDTLTLTIDTDLSYTITGIPDLDAINFLRV